MRYCTFLLLLILHFLSSALVVYAQDDAPPEVIKTIRAHYYGVNNRLPELDEVLVREGLSAWFEEGALQKLVHQQGAGHQTEYYFAGSSEVLHFVYDVQEDEEQRYYFMQMAAEFGPDVQLNVLCRWLDAMQTYHLADEEEFERRGWTVSQTAQRLYAEVMARQSMGSAAFEQMQQKAQPFEQMVEELDVSTLREQITDLIPASQDSAYEAEFGYKPCYDLSKKYFDAQGQLRLHAKESGCDGGHMLADSQEEMSYYDEHGEPIAQVVRLNTHIFGTDAALYELGSYTLSEVVYSYYAQGILVKQVSGVWLDQYLVQQQISATPN